MREKIAKELCRFDDRGPSWEYLSEGGKNVFREEADKIHALYEQELGEIVGWMPIESAPQRPIDETYNGPHFLAKCEDGIREVWFSYPQPGSLAYAEHRPPNIQWIHNNRTVYENPKEWMPIPPVRLPKAESEEQTVRDEPESDPAQRSAEDYVETLKSIALCEPGPHSIITAEDNAAAHWALSELAKLREENERLRGTITEHQMGPREFTEGVYLEAIEKLKRGMTQLSPDGNCCAICEDSGHQAWECHHNPLVAMQLMWAYRCYHCGRIFWDGETAADHFGPRESDITCYQKMRDRAEAAERELSALRAMIDGGVKVWMARDRAGTIAYKHIPEWDAKEELWQPDPPNDERYIEFLGVEMPDDAFPDLKPGEKIHARVIVGRKS
jgi:hypothetical protein